MALGDVSLACAWALVDELAAGGVRHACLSPGSRSTPLALALSRHPGIELQVHLDERSSAFVALGVARATDRPVVVACTSGTAAAEYLPAVVEASRSRAPLVLLTADRPPRLRGTGANQTIDQTDLYGVYAEHLEPPVPASPDDVGAWRAAGRDALLGVGRTRQPVQVNCPFEEPLTPSAGVDLTPTTEAVAWPGDERAGISTEDADRLADEVSERRGVVVVGALWPDRLAHLGPLDLLGWPVLAEPASELRSGHALAAGQALIADEPWIGRHRPEVVLQLGAAPTTRATQRLVADAERLIVADRVHPDPDPERRAAWRLRADASEVLAALEARTRTARPAPRVWVDAWADADRRARAALDRTMDGWAEPSEPRVARDVAARVPPGGTLLVGSSTPIRDLDLAMAPRGDLRVVANRGASGIDGLVSTAVGVASARPDGPTVALIGDLSLLHDAGALLWNGRRTDLDLTLVILDNGGGEIFSLLPQRALPEHRDLFVTPHRLDLGAVCTAAGAPHARVTAAADLVPALEGMPPPGVRVVVVAIDAERDRGHRDALRRAVADALA